MSEQIKFGDRLFLRGEVVYLDNGTEDGVLESRNGNVVIKGNLTVDGTTTTVNSVQTSFSDPIITLNGDLTGSPTEDVGVEVNRGTQPAVRFIWDETNDIWTFGAQNITTSGNISASYILATLSGNVVSANGAMMFNKTNGGSVDINAGTIDGTNIGSSVAAAGVFTTISGNGANITNVLTNYTTTNLAEGTNLYYTNERVDDRFNALFSAGYGISSVYNDTANSYSVGFDAQNVGSGSELYDSSNAVSVRFRTISTGNVVNGGNNDLTVSVVDNEVRIDTVQKINTLAYNSFTGNGSLLSYTLPYTVSSPWHLLVYIDGVIQEPTTAYTVGTNLITLTSPLPNGSVMNVIKMADSLNTVGITDATTFAGNSPSYYLNFENLTNVPTYYMVNNGNNSVSGNITPSTDNTRTLGNVSSQWQNVYSHSMTNDGAILSGATVTALPSVATNIYSYSATTISGARFVVVSRDTITGVVQSTEILVANTSSVAVATEYARITTDGNPIATFEVAVLSGSVVLSTVGVSNNIVHRVFATLVNN